MEDWNDISLQETPSGISQIGQMVEHCFGSGGQTYVPERVRVNSASKMQTLFWVFCSGFCPCVEFFTIGSNHICNPQ